MIDNLHAAKIRTLVALMKASAPDERRRILAAIQSESLRREVESEARK